MGKTFRFNGPKTVWSEAEAAARFLGMDVEHFREEALAFPQLLPRNHVSGRDRWHAHVLLAYMLVRPLLGDSPTREARRAAAKKPEKPSEEAPG